MTALVLVGAAWFAGSVVVAVVIGRAIAHRDRREVQAAMDRHPAGRERHLRSVS